MNKKIFSLLIVSILISCQNKVRDIYEVYPQGVATIKRRS